MEKINRTISFIYLLAVPVMVTVLAFAIGHVHYKIYLLCWLINAGIMALAVKFLAVSHSTAWVKAHWLLIIPWILIAIFGGMGPPPETAAAWAALATEQICRYSLLIISGISVSLAFVKLSKLLASTPGSKYALYSKMMILIALPLFILNMAYWGFFLTNVFIQYTKPGHPPKPEWLKTLSNAFIVIRMIEVALIYTSSAVMAIALHLAGKLSKFSTTSYVTFACLGAIFNFLPADIKGPLAIAGYLFTIPAFTLLMPYLMGVNLLYKKS